MFFIVYTIFQTVYEMFQQFLEKKNYSGKHKKNSNYFTTTNDQYLPIIIFGCPNSCKLSHSF